MSRQATLRHFSEAEAGVGEGAWLLASVETTAVAEVAGAGSVSRRMESMRAVGDKGVSTEDGCPGLASSTRGLRGGLGGSSLTCTKGLLDRGLDIVGMSGGAPAGSTTPNSVLGPQKDRTSDMAYLSSMFLPGEARGLVGASSVISEIMGPELVTESGA